MTEFTIQGEGGVSLQAYEWTPKTRALATVLLLHGLGDHAKRLAPVAEHLATSRFSVIGYDQRGHGGTAGGLPSFATLLADVCCALETLRSRAETPLFVYGISLGGGLALHTALRHPDLLSGVIASSPLLEPGFRPPRWKLTLAKWLHDLWPSFTLPSGLNANDLSRDPREVAAYKADPCVHPRVSAALGLSMLEAGTWTLAHAAELKVPALVMHGTHDRITSFAASQAFAQQAGPLCTFVPWEGAYHDLHFDLVRENALAMVCRWIDAHIDP